MYFRAGEGEKVVIGQTAKYRHRGMGGLHTIFLFGSFRRRGKPTCPDFSSLFKEEKKIEEISGFDGENFCTLP